MAILNTFAQPRRNIELINTDCCEVFFSPSRIPKWVMIVESKHRYFHWNGVNLFNSKTVSMTQSKWGVVLTNTVEFTESTAARSLRNRSHPRVTRWRSHSTQTALYRRMDSQPSFSQVRRQHRLQGQCDLRVGLRTHCSVLLVQWAFCVVFNLFVYFHCNASDLCNSSRWLYIFSNSYQQ